MIPKRIHIFGASGSGTTTFAIYISARCGHRHLDTDDFYWLPTQPPFQQKRPRNERLALLQQALAEQPTWALSGSLCGWGDPLIPQFDLVVSLAIPKALRMARLRRRARSSDTASAQSSQVASYTSPTLTSSTGRAAMTMEVSASGVARFMRRGSRASLAP